ncbi:Hypothetical protein D9617_17g046540 [Elsinoe fawcettii]|nr:Hypothetical protein D9617_17g046540 [Elsinoe fawcettii]
MDEKQEHVVDNVAPPSYSPPAPPTKEQNWINGPSVGPERDDSHLANIIQPAPIAAPQQTSSGHVTPQINEGDAPARVTPLKRLKTVPAWIDCRFCEHMTKTEVREQINEENPSGIVVLLMCLVCCPLLLCLPLMRSKTSTWHHTCSRCKKTVAVRQENGTVEVKEPPPAEDEPSRFGARNQQQMAEAKAKLAAETSPKTK